MIQTEYKAEQSAPGILRRSLNYGYHLRDSLHPGNNHERLISLCKGGTVLNVGGGPKRDHPAYINLNMFAMLGVDVVGDAAAIPFDDGTIAGVCCNAVLEHVPDPWKVVSEIFRVLKPGGYVYIEVPFLQHYHPSPEDFYRFTLRGTRELCKAFTEIDCGLAGGPMATLVEMVESYCLLVPINGMIRNLIKGGVRLGLYPLRLLEHLALRSPSAHTVANGFYFIGQKPIPH